MTMIFAVSSCSTCRIILVAVSRIGTYYNIILQKNAREYMHNTWLMVVTATEPQIGLHYASL